MDDKYTYTRVKYNNNMLITIINVMQLVGSLYAFLFLVGGMLVKAHAREAQNASIVRRAFDVKLIDDDDLTKLLGQESIHTNHEELIGESLQRQVISR